MKIFSPRPHFGATLTIRPEADLSQKAYEDTALLAAAKQDNLTKIAAIQDTVDPLKMEIIINAEGPAASIKTKANGSLNLTYDPAEGPYNFLVRLLTQAELKAKSLEDPQARAAKILKTLTSDVYSSIGYLASAAGITANVTISPYLMNDIDCGTVTFRFQKFDKGNNSFRYGIQKLDDTGTPDPSFYITLMTEGTGTNRWVKELELKNNNEDHSGQRMALDGLWQRETPPKYIFTPYYGGNNNGQNKSLEPAMIKLIDGIFTLVKTIETKNPLAIMYEPKKNDDGLETK
jgi:hypothetical protein